MERRVTCAGTGVGIALLLAAALGVADAAVVLAGSGDDYGWSAGVYRQELGLAFLGGTAALSAATVLGALPFVGLVAMLLGTAWGPLQRLVYWLLGGLSGPLAVLCLLPLDMRIRVHLGTDGSPFLMLGGRALALVAVSCGASVCAALLVRLLPGEARGPRWMGRLAGGGPVALAVGALLAIVAAPPTELETLSATPQGQADEQRPDIVLLMVDTLRADAVGFHDPARGLDTTPTLDALAREGVVFETTYAQSPWTRPSVASILSAELSAGHTVYTRADALPDGAETLPERLAATGYQTASIITNPNSGVQVGFGQGFDQVIPLGPPALTRSAIGRSLYLLGGPADVYYRSAEDVVDLGLRWWELTEGGGPRLLFLHFMDPHAPYFNGGRGWAANTMGVKDFPASSAPAQLASYLADVRYTDTQIARLIEVLRGGDWSRTVVALVSDHGEEFGEHGGWRHGHSLHDEVTRVPMMLSGGGLPGGLPSRVRRPVETTDLTPTLAAVAGASAAERWRGVNLLEWWSMESAARPAVSEMDAWGARAASLRAGDWKLIRHQEDEGPRSQLYEMGADPAEQADRAGADAPRAASLSGRLDAELARARSAALAGEAAAAESAALRAQLEALGYIGEAPGEE